MAQSLLARSAAPLALVAGALVVITRWVIMVTTPADIDSLKVYVLTATHAINGVASIDDSDPLRAAHPDADLIVRVRAREIFPNCPRYIHKLQMTELSAYAPRPEYQPPVPAWKQMEAFRDYLPSGPRHNQE